MELSAGHIEHCLCITPGPALDVTEDSLYKYNALLLSPAEEVPGDLVFITDNPHTITHEVMFSKWIIPSEKFEFINAASYLGKVVIDSGLSEEKCAGNGLSALDA